MSRYQKTEQANAVTSEGNPGIQTFSFFHPQNEDCKLK